MESKARDQASGCKKGSVRMRHRKQRTREQGCFEFSGELFKKAVKPGVVAHACNRSTSEAKQDDCKFWACLDYTVRGNVLRREGTEAGGYAHS